MHQSTGGSRRKRGRKCESDWSGIWFRYQSHFVIFVHFVMVHRPQCAMACFSAPILIDLFASTAPEQAHQSLCVSLPGSRPPATIRTSLVWECATTCGHTHTHIQKCNTLLRWPYVVHLTNKPTHWASHAGITCPFPGTISFSPCYWFNWHAKLTLTLFLPIII